MARLSPRQFDELLAYTRLEMDRFEVVVDLLKSLVYAHGAKIDERDLDPRTRGKPVEGTPGQAVEHLKAWASSMAPVSGDTTEWRPQSATL